MGLVKMRAIEYNLWMSIMKLLADKMPDILKEYGYITGTVIPVKPSYPSNIASIEKPSIIVRKVDTSQSNIGMGNVLGQFFDVDNVTYVDVYGVIHKTMLQFDVVTDSNTQSSILQSVISEEIFNNIMICNNGNIDLYDFTVDCNNPIKMGYVKVHRPCDNTMLDNSTATDKMHIGIVRNEFTLIQTIVPQQEFVDLSKWINITYNITI